MNLLYRNILFLVLFVTGAAVLIVEVTATRILAPYFGNTIYTFSSIIGVILSALSLGYYSGGKLADRRPSGMWFFGVIFAGGMSVLLLQILALTVLPAWGYELSIVSGPLILSVLLFFMPAFLLGILSPFAVRLQSGLMPGEGIGSISGKVFFWSTLGSISGSLLAGFVLIPRFGVGSIVVGVGITLVVTGLTGMRSAGLRARTGIVLILVAAAVAGAVYWISSVMTKVGVIYERDGVYTRLTVYDREFNGRWIRYLLQDRSASGALFLDSGETAFDYLRYYALAGLFREKVENVLVIGGGTYVLAALLAEGFPGANVDVSEIEPSLFNIGEKFFRVSKNPRIRNYIKDGRRFLHDSGKKYDVIFSDVYFSMTIPPHFATEEFFRLARDRLTGNGVFIGNFIGDFSRKPPSILLAEIKTLRSVFPNSYFFAVVSPGSAYVQNVIALGVNGERKIDFESPVVRDNVNPVIRGLPEHLIDLGRFEFSVYPILTDDFSPVGYLASRSLRHEFARDVNPFGLDEIKAVAAQMLRYNVEESGAQGRLRLQEFLIAEMKALSRRVEVQRIRINGVESVNIIGHFFPDNENKSVLIGTYYNGNPDGSAVLLEIARYLANTESAPAAEIDIAFFGDQARKKPAMPMSQSVIIVGSACRNEVVTGPEAGTLGRFPSRSPGRCNEDNLEKTYSEILGYLYPLRKKPG
ncbi:MAG: hypothetical protein GXP46_06115 [Deferribacteres bacterium]|nr:hypothetical protein [Deferribacteres bacterium]